jgi:serine/threonine-protein kinase
MAALFWVFYTALEPYVRRRWPQSLITWNRLLAGRIRDPLVGGHLLVGSAVGLIVCFLVELIRTRTLTNKWQPQMGTLLGTGRALSVLLDDLTKEITFALGVLFFFLLVPVLLRRKWLAGTVITFLTVVAFSEGQPSAEQAALLAASFGLLLWTLMRFGVLPMAAALSVSNIVYDFPVTSDLSAWYAGPGLGCLLAVLVFPFWSFRTALGRRPLLGEAFLE